jgi:hypothetical protein
MQVTIARLSDLGWSFAKFEVSGFEGYNNEESSEAKFTEINFKFRKKDERVDERKFDVKEFKKHFSEQTGLYIEDVTEYDDYVYVEFDSVEYDGELPTNTDNRLEKVAELYGFDEYEYSWPQKNVKFYW